MGIFYVRAAVREQGAPGVFTSKNFGVTATEFPSHERAIRMLREQHKVETHHIIDITVKFSDLPERD